MPIFKRIFLASSHKNSRLCDNTSNNELKNWWKNIILNKKYRQTKLESAAIKAIDKQHGNSTWQHLQRR